MRTKDLATLLDILTNAHRRMDERGYPPANTRRSWSEFRSDEKPVRRRPRTVKGPVIRVRDEPLAPGPWVINAACKGQLDVMFCPGGASNDRHWRRQQQQAITICMSCPVLYECRAWALTDPEPAIDGVAGGMTPMQRQRWRLQK